MKDRNCSKIKKYISFQENLFVYSEYTYTRQQHTSEYCVHSLTNVAVIKLFLRAMEYYGLF